MVGSWTVEPGQLQVQVAGQVINGAAGAGLAAVMIPLPGRLLRISCSSFLIPRLSSGLLSLKSWLRFSSKRSSMVGLNDSNVVDAVVVAVVVNVDGGVVASVVEDSRILVMYFMYHSSMLLMFDADGGLVVVVVVVGAVTSLVFGVNTGRLTKTVFMKEG